MTHEVFKNNYLPLSDALYRVAYYILENEADARDAVQDLFVKLLSLGNKLDSVANPKAFSVTLLRNMCIDRIRAAKRIVTVPCSEDTPGLNLLVAEDDVLASKEKYRRVLAIIEGLPTKQREVLRQRVFEEKSYEQISKSTALSENNLRVLLSMARKTIKKESANL